MEGGLSPLLCSRGTPHAVLPRVLGITASEGHGAAEVSPGYEPQGALRAGALLH